MERIFAPPNRTSTAESRTSSDPTHSYQFSTALSSHPGCQATGKMNVSLDKSSWPVAPRIGANEEGIFRNHIITSTGRIRHLVYYSIIEFELPAVKVPLHRNSPTGPDQSAGRTLRGDRGRGPAHAS